MFTWSEDKIRFLKEAAEYTGFYEKIADELMNVFTPSQHICDVGCGLGYLSLALSKRCREVTAVDISQETLDVLRQKMEEQHVENIHVVCEDVLSENASFENEVLPANEKSEGTYDGMVMCFFGSIEEVLPIIRKSCSGKAVLVKKNWETHRFNVAKKPLEKYNHKDSIAVLENLGVPYETREFDLEMGQPFKSLEDCVRFFHVHDRDGSSQSMTIEEAAKLVSANDDEQYPYFLSSNRRIGFIIIDAEDVK